MTSRSHAQSSVSTLAISRSAQKDVCRWALSVGDLSGLVTFLTNDFGLLRAQKAFFHRKQSRKECLGILFVDRRLSKQF